MSGDVPVAYNLLMHCKNHGLARKELNVYHSDTRRQPQTEDLFFFLHKKHQRSNAVNFHVCLSRTRATRKSILFLSQRKSVYVL